MAHFLVLLICLLAAVFCVCDAFKILVVFPFPGKSHGILGDGVVRLLADRGHEVTYITPYPSNSPRRDVRYIDVSSNAQAMNTANITSILNKEQGFSDIRVFFNVLLKIHGLTVSNENVQKLLNDPKQTFDLVIAEWIMNEILAGFSAVYNCPYIWLSSIEPHSNVLGLIDEGLNPAYNPSIISASSPPYNFVQRVKELAVHIVNSLLKRYYEIAESDIYEEGFGPILKKRGRPVPSYKELQYNASMVLGNSHVSLGRPTRLPQNYIPLRGYHIDPVVQPLPNDLKNLLDNARNGLIYFSMGSTMNSDSFPTKLKRDLLKVFGTLKQTVLWKFEEALPDLPSNVHIVKWAPQTSILAHPNCILFITHGGALSITEAVHFGKPTIGIPAFGDQFTNVEMVVNLGMSLKVDLSYNMIEELKVALEDMLYNPKYATKARELSFIYHHRPVPPGQELVHWVEHVVRTRGAPHLRSPALAVPFYQKYYLDLAAVVIVLYYILKATFRKLCRKKTVQKKQKKN